ncbi:MAG TPA: HlyD family type I secretion periplasmic adaptor subunit [Hyphomicrobiaceae bacterium]|jgi:HlyD family secretion protein|nr:HlyD family type I secretion periplasmic adaptor subunit [Hyphomicrobiaceae bacterium]
MPITDTKAAIQRHLWAGLTLLIVLCGGVGGWAATTEISGAVIAPGVLVVDSNVKKVQHPTGGVVGEIRARDGDRVAIGDIVVRLDETVTRANLGIVLRGLDELVARKARLEAERDGLEGIAFPSEFIERLSEPQVAAIIAGERKLFDLRQSARVGQKSQLRERIAQLREEIGGIAAQIKAKAQEIVLIQRELTGARDLWEKNLMPITKLTQLEREATRLEGERAQLTATSAQSKGKISELELQIIQVDRDLASEVGKELREVDAKIGEFVERKVAAEDQLKRIDIRAPQDGVVHQSVVHTIGGVINAGEQLMLIVPSADSLIVEAKFAPQDIDQVKIGQRAVVRFTSFNQRTTPELNGVVTRVSADTTVDQRTSAPYYTLRISLSREEIARLGEVTLVPGMPVESFIQTGDRKVISYLMKPLSDQVMRAFRER